MIHSTYVLLLLYNYDNDGHEKETCSEGLFCRYLLHTGTPKSCNRWLEQALEDFEFDSGSFSRLAMSLT